MTRAIILLTFLILNHSCSSASYPDVSRNNSNTRVQQNTPILCRENKSVKVAIDSRFSELEKRWISDALPYLSTLDIQASVTSNNDVDVTIVFWENHPQGFPLRRCENHRVGEFKDGTNYVLIDSTCSKTQQQFMAAVIHEIGHWLGLKHVCDRDGRTSDTCSSVGRGVAVMNPYLAPDHVLTPTLLDLLELDRAYFRRCTRLGE